MTEGQAEATKTNSIQVHGHADTHSSCEAPLAQEAQEAQAPALTAGVAAAGLALARRMCSGGGDAFPLPADVVHAPSSTSSCFHATDDDFAAAYHAACVVRTLPRFGSEGGCSFALPSLDYCPPQACASAATSAPTATAQQPGAACGWPWGDVLLPAGACPAATVKPWANRMADMYAPAPWCCAPQQPAERLPHSVESYIMSEGCGLSAAVVVEADEQGRWW